MTDFPPTTPRRARGAWISTPERNRVEPRIPKDNRAWDIDSSRIGVRGGIETAGLIALLLAGLLVDLPALRSVTVWGAAVGVVFGVVLILWRRR